jgi:3-phenylpropionate/trans-cinnamate dioxygenase ferredoxin subunit
MAEFKRVGSSTEIPENGMKAFEIDHERIVVCRSGGEFFALADECSHDGAPVSMGHLMGREIVCPRHGARFSIVDGRVTGPPAVAPIDSFELKVEGTDIYVRLADD